MLCVGSGSGVLSLMAARSGAGHVSSCERSKTMYGMAKIALNSNR
jgi:tRNA1(Val) A37 N6-methylase TrmN6